MESFSEMLMARFGSPTPETLFGFWSVHTTSDRQVPNAASTTTTSHFKRGVEGNEELRHCLFKVVVEQSYFLRDFILKQNSFIDSGVPDGAQPATNAMRHPDLQILQSLHAGDSISFADVALGRWLSQISRNMLRRHMSKPTGNASVYSRLQRKGVVVL